MVLSREELVFKAKVCEQTERFEDMLELMKTLITEHSQELSVEERNLLSVAYKNSVGPRRSAWRVLVSLENKEESKPQAHTNLLKEYKAKVEKELESICTEIINFLETKLIPGAQKAKAAISNPGVNNKDWIALAETEIFYLKMKGDYFRYISEFSGESNKTSADKAEEAYAAATAVANNGLKKTNPIRLGLALNFSVFYYEVRNDPTKACKLAKSAFDEAIADIESLEEGEYKDATTILQLIRDNLTLWTSELEEQDSQK